MTNSKKLVSVLLGSVLIVVGCINETSQSPDPPPSSGSSSDTVAADSSDETIREKHPTTESPPTEARTISPAASAIKQGAEAIRRERERMDETVWAPEVLSQRYGGCIHELWDDLRLKSEKFAVLEGLSFGTLILAKPLETETLDGGITVHRFVPGGEALTPDAWRKWLAKFQSDNYQIVQSEWHHPGFTEPTEDEPAKSKVTATIHAAQTGEARKVIVEATLDITWNRQPDADGTFQPDTIKVKELTITERQGEPVFREIAMLGETIKKAEQVSPALVYDLNQDGFPEIVLPGINKLYWNRGGRFEEDQLCEEPAPPGAAAIIADFTGDGMPDLITAGNDTFATLFRGDPTGRFAGQRQSISVTDGPLRFPMNMTAGDIDADGDLDLWIAQYVGPYERGQMPTPYYDANDGEPSYLLRNLGDGQFEDATEAVGLAPKRFRRTYSSSFVDLDEDRDLDMMVVSDFSGIDVYRNDGGRFVDITDQAVDDRANFGMGHALDDFNRDGKLDIYVAGMYSNTAARMHGLGLGRAEFTDYQSMRPHMGYGNRLYVRQPNGTFRAPSFAEHVARTGWSWGTASLDFDLDGDRDLYVANGHVSGKKSNDYCTTFWRHDIYTGNSRPNPALSAFFKEHLGILPSVGISWNGFEHNHLLVNLDGQDFIEAGFLMDVAFEEDSRTVVCADFNRDGRPDLLVVLRPLDWSQNPPMKERVYVFENNWPQAGNWIGVRLRETKEAPSPIGAKITVTAGDQVQVAQVVTGDSFRAQHPPVRLFGLGTTTQIDAVEVTWPNGQTVKLENPGINQYLDIPARQTSASQ